MRIIIVHGWEGTPEGNWFPWLAAELKAQEHSVLVPAMPDTMHPKMDAWVKHLAQVVGTPDTDTILVGHSLGAIGIFRYLETLKEGEQVGSVISVAGFLEKIAFRELDSFFETPLNNEKVRQAVAGDIVAVYSDNDPYVPVEHAGYLRDRLGAILVPIPSGGHLNASDGFTEFPKLHEVIVALERKSG